MKVLKNKILIKPIKEEAKVIAGFEIPPTDSNDGTEKAEVILIGSEISEYYAVSTIHEGSRLIIYKGAGSEFTNPDNKEKYRVITESDIIVVLD